MVRKFYIVVLCIISLSLFGNIVIHSTSFNNPGGRFENIERFIVITKDPYTELQDPNNQIKFHNQKKSIMELRKNLEWINKDNTNSSMRNQF